MKVGTDTYKKELKLLEEKMIKSEKWAKKMPLFETQIIEQKTSGEELYQKYGEKYKSIYLGWGINRGYYELGTPRYMTNNSKKHKGFFWSIYINSCSLFDNHNNYDLEELLNTIDVYYFDKMNTTIYVTDNQIETLLELLNNWYLSSLKTSKEQQLIEKKKKLEDELKRLNDV